MDYPEEWERVFPGHGHRIAAFAQPFLGWKPEAFGKPEATLEDDILANTKWQEGLAFSAHVELVPISRAQDEWARIDAPIVEAFHEVCDTRFRASGYVRQSWHNRNEAFGGFYGPVVGNPGSPGTFLRSWLYNLALDAIDCACAGEEDLLRQLEACLAYWRRGQFLVGFEKKTGTALVFVADS